MLADHIGPGKSKTGGTINFVKFLLFCMFQYSGKTDVLQSKDPLPPLLFQARETETICWQNNGLQVLRQ